MKASWMFSLLMGRTGLRSWTKLLYLLLSRLEGVDVESDLFHCVLYAGDWVGQFGCGVDVGPGYDCDDLSELLLGHLFALGCCE